MEGERNASGSAGIPGAHRPPRPSSSHPVAFGFTCGAWAFVLALGGWCKYKASARSR